MSTKRVILANNSRLLREMLQHIIHRAHSLEVVQVIFDQENLSSAIERLEPEWVVVSARHNDQAGSWLRRCVAKHPGVQFIAFSPDQSRVQIRSQTCDEQDITNVSLNDFIQLLGRDLEHS